MRWVVGQFELSRQRDTLRFGHHAEVAALPGPKQDFWLLKVEEFGWPVTRLRRELQASLAEAGQGATGVRSTSSLLAASNISIPVLIWPGTGQPRSAHRRPAACGARQWVPRKRPSPRRSCPP
jgi:hypothetical protein